MSVRSREPADGEAHRRQARDREQQRGVEPVARAPLAAALLTQDRPDRGRGVRCVVRQAPSPVRRWWPAARARARRQDCTSARRRRRPASSRWTPGSSSSSSGGSVQRSRTRAAGAASCPMRTRRRDRLRARDSSDCARAPRARRAGGSASPRVSAANTRFSAARELLVERQLRRREPDARVRRGRGGSAATVDAQATVSPAVGRSSPTRMRSSVLLPEPFAPGDRDDAGRRDARSRAARRARRAP